MNKKTYIFAINSLLHEMPRLAAIAAACDAAHEIRVIVGRDEKKDQLARLFFRRKPLKFNKVRQFLFLLLGLINFYKYFWVRAEIRKSIFYGFVLSRTPRRGSYRFLTKIDYFYLRNIFFIRIMIAIGLHTWLKSNNCQRIVFQERTKIPEVFVYHLCVASGIDCIQCIRGAFNNALVAKRLNKRNALSHPMSMTSWKNDHRTFLADFSENFEADRVNKFYEEMNYQRYVRNTWYNRNKIQDTYQKKELNKINVSGFEKTVLIATHIFWDAAFAYGKNVFDDYSIWFDACASIAKARPNHLFIIKLHPDLLFKQPLVKTQFDHLKYIKSKIKDLDNCVIILPEHDVDIITLLEEIDLVLTVRGTLGLEAACLGTPVLTAGEGRYDGLGFTYDCSSQDDYLNMFDKAIDAKLDPQNLEKARYVFESLYKRKHFVISGLDDNLDRTHDHGSEEVFKIFSMEEFKKSRSYSRICRWLESDEFDLLQPFEDNNSRELHTEKVVAG